MGYNLYHRDTKSVSNPESQSYIYTSSHARSSSENIHVTKHFSLYTTAASAGEKEVCSVTELAQTYSELEGFRFISHLTKKLN